MVRRNIKFKKVVDLKLKYSLKILLVQEVNYIISNIVLQYVVIICYTYRYLLDTMQSVIRLTFELTNGQFIYRNIFYSFVIFVITYWNNYLFLGIVTFDLHMLQRRHEVVNDVNGNRTGASSIVFSKEISLYEPCYIHPTVRLAFLVSAIQ